MYSTTLALICVSHVLLATNAQDLHPTACKYVPGSLFWPSLSDWVGLNQSLGGVLLSPDAPAAACHPDKPEYDPEVCSQITASWNSSQWHSDNPTSSLWQNWNNYSCLPDPKAPCSTDGYPLYVVNASTADHVRTAVNFARTKNLRLNIKSTGHDFLGRSVQPKSLSIWTHHIRDLTWHESTFSPKGCNVIIDTPAVTAGSGTQMRQLYRAAADKHLMIVGGSSSTVSVGGYITGGGHSALSPMYGMAADNVMEVEIVTPNGELIVANECSNTDLFWATRGGGPAFGVIISFTLRAIPAVPTTTWSGEIIGMTNTSANWDAITYIHAQWPRQLSAFGISGYMIGTPYLLGPLQGTFLQVIMPNSSSISSLQDKLEPILAQVSVITHGAVNALGAYMNYQTYGELVAPNGVVGDDSTTFPGDGMTKLIASWLYDEQALSSPDLKQALMGSVDNQTLLFNDFTAGPGTHNPPFIRGGGNAVNPAWRSAIVRPAAELQWPGLDLVKLEQRKADAQRFGASLRQLAPNMGAYENEANVDTPDAQRAFFGSNYPRLLSIKRVVDPDGVFWCRTCVGSEMWKETSTGELCLTSSTYD